MKTNRLVISIVLILCTLPATAQKDKFKFAISDVKPEDFAPTFYPVDSAADAIYLFDVGSSEYVGNKQGDFSVVFQKKARIHLMNKNSFDLATVKIYLDGGYKDDEEKLESFEAATYNIEGGKIVVTKVDKNSLFTEKEDGYKVLKFTFPNIKEGSIIEYSYKKNSPDAYYLNGWQFQGNYPKLWSEYTIHTPQIFDFITFKQGYLPYEIDTAEIHDGDFISIGVIAKVFKHTWAIKDVPSIKKEAYVTNINNYRSKLTFQLYAINYRGGNVNHYLKDWKSAVDALMANQNFGLYLTDDLSWLKGDLKVADANSLNLLNNATNIYKYVQGFSNKGNAGLMLSQSLRAIDIQKKGFVSDLNLFLVALLRSADFEAYPVLLSTWEHGKAYDLYPIMNKFNYVIVQVKINGTYYLLDASNKNLGFGQLSNECYNGNARVIAPVSVMVHLSADSLRETSRTFVNLFNDGGGKISGTYSEQLGEMESLGMKDLLLKESKDDYFADLKKTYPDNISITNSQMDSIRIPGEPVTISFDMAAKLEEDIIYFNPMLGHAIKENPFTAAERFYPVEMPYITDDTYTFNMEVPEGYTVDELPKSARINFNENEGSFDYIIAASGGRIQLSCRLRLNKATFEPADYQSLRDLYTFIVEKEGEQIVFKKDH